MNLLTDISIFILIIMPVINIFGLLCTLFFLTIFGGKIDKIIIGTNKNLITWGKLKVNCFYFNGYWYEYDYLEKDSIFSRMTILLADIFFKMVLITILYLLITFNIINLTFIVLLCFIYIFYWIIIQIIPKKYGSTIVQEIVFLFRYEKIKLLAQDIRNIELFTSKIDKEIERLEYTTIDFLAKRVLSLIIYKAGTLMVFARFEDAINTLNTINIDCLEEFNAASIYYNNVLYA